jgi:hypothetical protein
VVDVWIVEVRFADDVVDKLRVKHRLEAEDVERSVRFGALESAYWHDHPDYGRRLIAKAKHPNDDTDLLVYLAPIDEKEGIWICKTALRPRA